MANNLDITKHDFENICRTCLSSEDLNSLYEGDVVELLMTCTVIKFAVNDGLPAKICINCINEVNRAFSFAKRCETTDKILQKCVIKLETKVAYSQSHSRQAEPTIKTEEEIKTESIYRTVKDVLGEYGCMEDVKQEEDVKMEFEEHMLEFQVETKVKIECNETYDDPVNEINEEQDDEEVQNDTYSDNFGFRNRYKSINSQIMEKSSKDDNRENYNDLEKFVEDDIEDETYFDKPDSRLCQINDDEGIQKSDNSGSRPKRKCTISQIKDKGSKDDDNETYDDPADESDEEEDDDEDQDETYSETPGDPRLKEGSTKNKISQHKHDRYSKSSNRLYKCETCGKSFNRLDLLKSHQKGIHAGKKPHICEVCSKAFNDRSTLIRHKRIHTGEKPYICDVCSKAFSESSTLQRHKRIHTGQKPHICEVCSKAFDRSSSLQTHMRVHTGEKPYICDVCSRAFSYSHVLQQHKRIHTGEKPYICDVCSKAFSQSHHLQIHMRIHTGEKPYICDVCSKAFSESFTLQRHKRIHTG